MNKYLLFTLVLIFSVFTLFGADGIYESKQFNKAELEKAPFNNNAESSKQIQTYFKAIDGGPAYGMDVLGGNWIRFNLNDPANPTTIGANAGAYFAGDFADEGMFYAINNDNSNVVSVDSSTGASTVVGTATVTAGHTWTGMTYDITTGTMYASSTDGTVSYLYTIDLETGAATVVGSTTTAPIIIDIAINNEGQMYAVDIGDDNLYSIDKTTAAATAIGTIGFDASFAQGMDFNPVNDSLYLAAYNYTISAAEFRVVDLASGASTLIGPIGAGSGVEVCAFGISGSPADDADPNPPEDVVAYSDYTTPTAINLTWTDPTTTFDGTPIDPADFTIEIEEGGELLASVPGGTGMYDAIDLMDGTMYEFTLYAKLVANDSISSTVNVAWYAGGSPVPSAPVLTSVTGTADTVMVYWINPTTNVDGTPLDDFDGIYLYQDGMMVQNIDFDPGDIGTESSLQIIPETPGYYTWTVSAYDNEDPVNESMMSNGMVTPIGYPFNESFEGDLGLFVNGAGNGVDWAVNSTFYADGAYSAHNAYSMSNDNVLEVVGSLDLTGAVDPKFAFLQICKTEGGYDFGFVEYSLDGGATWMAFPVDAYEGAGDYTDGFFEEDSYADWGTSDVVPENTWWKFEVFSLSSFIGENNFKVRFRLQTDGSVTRYGWLIDAVFIGEPDADPMMDVAPTELEETLLVNATASLNFEVFNTQMQLSTLNYTITEDPAVDWMEVMPTSGMISQASSEMITVNLDATGMETGTYSADLIVAGDDPVNAYDTVQVTLHVNASPIVGFTPDSLGFSLDPGQIDSLLFSITNTGAGPLDFTLTDEDVISFKRAVQPQEKRYPDYYYGMEIPKEGFDPRQGIPPVKGAGGPDMFGYKWIDSDEPGGPTFNWIDISGTGTEVTGLMDDNNVGPFPIGFTFEFYGEEYSEFYVQSNGTINFIDEYISLSNQPIPAVDSYNNLLAWFWDDLNPTASGQVFYETVGNQLIIQFVNYSEYGGNLGTVDAEVIISANGAITYQYLSFKNDMDLIGCTVGIENQDGTDGLEVVYNAAYLHDELAVRFSAESAWLSEGITEGTVEAGGSMDIWAYANSTGLLGGDHLAKIIISSNDPVTPETFIPVGLYISGIPVIEVDPADVTFAEPVFVNGMDSLALTVSNTGTTTLHVTDIVSDNVVFTVDQTVFDLNVGQSTVVMVHFAPTAAQQESGYLTITSDDPVNGSLQVALSGTGIMPPQISVEPTELVVGVSGLDSTDVVVTISNVADAGAANLECVSAIGPAVTKISIPAVQPGEVSQNAKVPENYNSVISPVPEKTYTVPSGLKSLKGIVSVLVICPDNPTPPTALVDVLNAFEDVEAVLYPYADLSTITVDDLLPYHVVFAFNDLTWESVGSNAAAIGDLLADYIDAGGKVIDNMYLHSFDAWGLQGRYISEQYSCFTTATADNWNPTAMSTVYEPGHPLMAGVTAVGQTWGVQDPGLAAGALRIADWDDGNIFVAVNADENVVGINTMPVDPNAGPTWTGDMPTLFHNAIVYLGGGGSFIEIIGESAGNVAPLENMQLNLRVFGLEVPDTSYYASVTVTSNDPVTPEVVIPVTINVGALGINDVVVLPTTFDVKQNYPNPFNPSTTIHYQLPKKADVKLVIYNVMGQKIKTLIDKNVAAGSYDVKWNGLNEAGAQISSGVYFYRFEAGDFVKMRKMILLK